MKAELLAVSDWVWGRTEARLADLEDEELFWEPYPGCWTLRQLRDGSWVSDGAPDPEVAPLTTIVWRIIHLIGCYGAARNSQWVAVKVDLPALESSDSTPTTAVEARDILARAHARWRVGLVAVEEADLDQVLGPIAGQWAESSRVAFLIHQIDEIIHHSAEIGVMRDLYRASAGRLYADPVVARLVAGDLSAFEENSGADLVTVLAGAGRWDLVEAAVARGLSPDGPAPTALHRAAAAGVVPIVEMLVSAGASRDALDPHFQATPAEWAQFYGHPEVAARLAPG